MQNYYSNNWNNSFSNYSTEYFIIIWNKRLCFGFDLCLPYTEVHCIYNTLVLIIDFYVFSSPNRFKKVQNKTIVKNANPKF